MNLNIKTYAFICTRSGNATSTTRDLVNYLTNIGVKVELLVDRKSIFSAYHDAVQSVNPGDNDIVIFCHDDIEILNKGNHFAKSVSVALRREVGFIGVAGTITMPASGVWWSPQNQEDMRGIVWHGTSDMSSPTYYGPYTNVVVLDGVFLAASGRTLRTISLEKPEEYHGNWDFYDIHYTTQTYYQGYHNFVVPIHVRHESPGEVTGRVSWKRNKNAFIATHELPMQLEEIIKVKDL